MSLLHSLGVREHIGTWSHRSILLWISGACVWSLGALVCDDRDKRSRSKQLSASTWPSLLTTIFAMTLFIIRTGRRSIHCRCRRCRSLLGKMLASSWLRGEGFISFLSFSGAFRFQRISRLASKACAKSEKPQIRKHHSGQQKPFGEVLSTKKL